MNPEDMHPDCSCPCIHCANGSHWMCQSAHCAPLERSLPDFDKLFRDLDSTVATSVRSATFEGVRLGIGFACSSIDAAYAKAEQCGASQDTLAWLRLTAATLRKASASDELARALEQ